MKKNKSNKKLLTIRKNIIKYQKLKGNLTKIKLLWNQNNLNLDFAFIKKVKIKQKLNYQKNFKQIIKNDYIK